MCNLLTWSGGPRIQPASSKVQPAVLWIDLFSTLRYAGYAAFVFVRRWRLRRGRFSSFAVRPPALGGTRTSYLTVNRGSGKKLVFETGTVDWCSKVEEDVSAKTEKVRTSDWRDDVDAVWTWLQKIHKKLWKKASGGAVKMLQIAGQDMEIALRSPSQRLDGCKRWINRFNHARFTGERRDRLQMRIGIPPLSLACTWLGRCTGACLHYAPLVSKIPRGALPRSSMFDSLNVGSRRLKFLCVCVSSTSKTQMIF